MNLKMKSGQRELARIAMTLLTKKAEKVKKATAELSLSTADVDALLSRAGLVVAAIGVPANTDVHLTFALRVTLRQGLDMLFDEVDSTREDELGLGIDTEGSTAKLDEIRALVAGLAEQRSFADEVMSEIREHADEISAELSRDLPEGTTATLTVHR